MTFTKKNQHHFRILEFGKHNIRFHKYKTYFLKLIVVLIISLLSSCTNDDDEILLAPAPQPSLALTITTQTEEDQMGDFANNAMAIFGGKVWSVGGSNSYGGIGTHNTWTSTNGINWVTVTGPFPDFIQGHTLTTFNSQLWLIGGENSAGDPLSTIWHYDGTTWSSLPAPFGNIGHHHSSVLFDGKMYVIGGSLDTLNSIVWSTTNGTDWVEETSNAAFSGRVYHEAVVFNDAIYIIGGEDVAPNRLNDVWTSTNGSVWTQVTTLPAPPETEIFSERNKFTATVYNDKVWVIGGETTTGYANDIWYSSDMINWHKYTSAFTLNGLHEHAALLYSSELWLFGGNISTGETGKIMSLKEI